MTNFDKVLVLTLALLTAKNAHAYLDAGSLTIFLQGIVAAVVGGVVAIKNGWINLRVFTSKKKSNETKNE